MAEALDKGNKPPVCIEPRPLKNFSKPTNINPVPEGCSVV